MHGGWRRVGGAWRSGDRLGAVGKVGGLRGGLSASGAHRLLGLRHLRHEDEGWGGVAGRLMGEEGWGWGEMRVGG